MHVLRTTHLSIICLQRQPDNFFLSSCGRSNTKSFTNSDHKSGRVLNVSSGAPLLENSASARWTSSRYRRRWSLVCCAKSSLMCVLGVRLDLLDVPGSAPGVALGSFDSTFLNCGSLHLTTCGGVTVNVFECVQSGFASNR